MIAQTIDLTQRLRAYFSGLTTDKPKEIFTIQKLFDSLSLSAHYFISNEQTAARVRSFLPRFDAFIERYSTEEEEHRSYSALWILCFSEAEKMLPEAQRWKPNATQRELLSLIGAWAELLFAILLYNLDARGTHIAAENFKSENTATVAM